MEEGESGANVASADVRPYLERADEPGASLHQSVFTFDSAWPGEAEHKSIQRRREAKRESILAKTGYNLGTTALPAGRQV